jgi:hypothetical protein
MRKQITLLTVAILATLSVGLAFGQASPASTTAPPELLVNYFVNANTAGAPNGTVQLTNTGSTGTAAVAANVWALIYVLDADEEMSACCSCELTPNDLRTLSINGDLTSSPLTSNPLTRGTITIISSSSITPTKIIPSGSIRAWGTHILTTGVAEEEFLLSGLGAAEAAQLQSECSAIELDGSGHGICSCGNGS